MKAQDLIFALQTWNPNSTVNVCRNGFYVGTVCGVQDGVSLRVCHADETPLRREPRPDFSKLGFSGCGDSNRPSPPVNFFMDYIPIEKMR
jgi:hypothetical protein